MDLTVPPGAAATPVATSIDAGLGTVEIRVPRDADVRFTGESGLGSVEFDDQETDGPGARLSVTTSAPTASPPAGRSCSTCTRASGRWRCTVAEPERTDADTSDRHGHGTGPRAETR